MIKIIAGVYGYKENGIILPKDKDSEPFSLDPEREAELVAQGVAEYANVIIPEAELEPEPENAGAEQQSAEDPAEPEAEEPERDLEPEADGDEDPQSEKAEKPEYSDKMRLTELQALAGAYGLDAQNMRTKAEVIKLLDDYFAEEDDTEAPPAFGAMDPVE
jgi:hypothetical protein